MFVCQCCALATINADTSGCETYCEPEHHEHLENYGLDYGTYVIDAVEDGTYFVSHPKTCAGCGDDMYAISFELFLV